MTGKVFQESANIYDDEAKVLFEYYRNAAEKIVNEEVDLENKIENEEKKIAEATKKKKTALIVYIIGYAIGGGCGIATAVLSILAHTLNTPLNIGLLVGAVIGLGFGLGFMISFFKLKKFIIECSDKIVAFSEAKDAVRRDYKVTKLGVAYVPVATKVPFEGKSFTVDHTGGMDNTDFSLTVIHKPKDLQESLVSLEEGMQNVPIVESNENAEPIDTSKYSLSMQNVTVHDYMGNMDRQIRNISYLLNDNEEHKVSLPIVSPNSEADQFLNEYTTTEVEDKPVVSVFDTSDFAQKLDGFAELSNLKKEIEKTSNEETTEYFKKLIGRLGDVVQVVSQAKSNSTSKVLNYTNNILYAVLKSGYNQYSPSLEADEIARIREASFNYEDSVESYTPFNLKQSSRVKYDLFSGAWIAEDNSRTSMPFGMNQVVEEVLMPVINNLMEETRIERLKIYNGIKDQKLSYLTKWNQDVEAAFRDNRKTGQELITELSNAYAEYTTAHQTYLSYKQTQQSMKATGSLESAEVQELENADELMVSFEAQASSCNAAKDEFQNYMDRLQEDIQLKADKFGHIEYYEASLRDSESRNMARSIEPSNLQSLDERRKKLIPVNAYYATYADLPPTPNVDDALLGDFTIDMQNLASEELAKIAEIEKQHAEMSEEAMNDEAVAEDEMAEDENVEDENIDDENSEEEKIADEVTEDSVDTSSEDEDTSEEDSDDDSDEADDDTEDDDSETNPNDYN